MDTLDKLESILDEIAKDLKDIKEAQNKIKPLEPKRDLKQEVDELKESIAKWNDALGVQKGKPNI